MEPIRIVGFYGIGAFSAGVRRNVKLLVEGLRELGLRVEYSEVTVPALDVEEFEPFVKIDEREIYIPSVPIEKEKLVDYVISLEIAASTILPLPVPA